MLSIRGLPLLKSLGVTSHILSLGSGAQLDVRADRIAIRCPTQPDYRWGNCLVFLAPHRVAETQIPQFRADFPEARHTAILWDDPDARPAAADEAFRERGFVFTELDVLVRHGPAISAPRPESITFSPVFSDADWAEVAKLQFAIGLEDGHDPMSYLPFMIRRMSERRREMGAGHLLWFGAFQGGQLVGDLGVILSDRLFRFQAVETQAAYRCQGIAAALVSHASRQVDALSPGRPQLILADPTSAAGRIYARLGYERAERIVAAIREGS